MANQKAYEELEAAQKELIAALSIPGLGNVSELCMNQLLAFAVTHYMAHVEVTRLVPNTRCL